MLNIVHVFLLMRIKRCDNFFVKAAEIGIYEKKTFTAISFQKHVTLTLVFWSRRKKVKQTGGFLCMYFIQHCFICRPSDSIVSEDAGIEPSLLRLRKSDVQKLLDGRQHIGVVIF